jgi:1-acyl-sn-glycerol-3-phosphate acyltransferase
VFLFCRRVWPVHRALMQAAKLPHPWEYAEEPLSLVQRTAFAPLGLVLLVLLPVRLLAFLLLSTLSSLCCATCARSFVFIRASHYALGRLSLVLFGCWPGMLHVRGRIDPDAPILVCAPHTGVFEALVMMAVAGCPRPVAMAAYGRNPLIGALFRATRGILVNATTSLSNSRTKPSGKVAPDDAPPAEGKRVSATNAVRQALMTHRTSFRRGDNPIAMTPEGTTSNGRAMLRFFTGAFDGGGPVQPVVGACRRPPLLLAPLAMLTLCVHHVLFTVKYPYRHYNAAAFLGSLPEHLIRGLLTPWQQVHVIFMPLYTPSEAEAADAKLYAENVRRHMASEAGVGLFDYDAKALNLEYRAKHRKS